jgi:predicted dehydrogenase
MRIKVAVIGAGSMGMNHLRVLQDLEEEQVQLVGAAEANEPVLQHAMRRFHVAGYTDFRQMVE